MKTQSLSARGSAIALFAALAVIGCSSGGGGAGCGGLQPLPNNARYTGPKTDNALNIRLSPAGVNYLNSNWQSLIGLFAPGNKLSFPFACAKFNVPVLGDVYIADQGGPTGGKLDGTCDAKDQPAVIDATITGFGLVPAPPDKINATLTLQINTPRIMLKKGCIECSIDFDSNRDPGGACPSTLPDGGVTSGNIQNCNRVAATVQFTIDQKWDKLLSFNITGVNGTQVCGSSGAPAKPSCFDPGDLDLNDECGCTLCTCYACSFVCDAADWDPIKNFLLEQLSPLLQDQIKGALADQSCESCGSGMKACPTAGGTAAVCENGVCMDKSVNPAKCVPRFLGVEGRMALASLLGGFGVPPTAELDLSAAAGSSVTVDQGISLGMRAGIKAVTVAPCVAPAIAPTFQPVPAPNFDDPSAAPAGYHVGMGIASPFLNTAFHEAHQSGALCIQVNSASVGLINTGLFKTFLPSLGKLATRDGKDAPMMIVLKPARPPTVVVGQGTFDPVTKKPIKPLLLVNMVDTTVDFYAMIDERYARLFSLTADIGLPLSLIFEGCDKVVPALGDLKTLITNIRTANSEMLAEDPKVLADLIPAVIGLAEPALAGALKGFSLPQLGSLKLKVNKTVGLGQIGTTEAYNHLGLYATLLAANATCAVQAPVTFAALKRSIMPAASEMLLQGKPLPWPVAVLEVRNLTGQGTSEFAYRVDDGMWSTFLAPTAAGELEVSHPAFLMQGDHVIEVRGRYEEEAHGFSRPVKVAFRVDWEAPELTLQLDRVQDRILATARDVVSPVEALQWSYRVGQGEFSDFGPAREIALSAVEAWGGVTVRVRDEMGNVAEAAWRLPTVAERPAGPSSEAADPRTSGCAAVGGAPLVLGLLAALGLRRRKRS